MTTSVEGLSKSELEPDHSFFPSVDLDRKLLLQHHLSHGLLNEDETFFPGKLRNLGGWVRKKFKTEDGGLKLGLHDILLILLKRFQEITLSKAFTNW